MHLHKYHRVRLFGFSKYPNYIERIGILVDLVRFFRAKITLEYTALGLRHLQIIQWTFFSEKNVLPFTAIYGKVKGCIGN